MEIEERQFRFQIWRIFQFWEEEKIDNRVADSPACGPADVLLMLLKVLIDNLGWINDICRRYKRRNLAFPNPVVVFPNKNARRDHEKQLKFEGND